MKIYILEGYVNKNTYLFCIYRNQSRIFNRKVKYILQSILYVYIQNNQIFNTYKLNKHYLLIGENMNESFKINIYYDEKGENLENLIEHLIINMLEKNICKQLEMNYINKLNNFNNLKFSLLEHLNSFPNQI